MYAIGTRRFWGELLRLFLAVFATISFLMRPAIAAEGIVHGLTLCYRSVIPALFPFFVLSNLILTSPFASVLSLPLLPYTRFVLRVHDKRASTALLLGMASGFGGGASCLQTLYRTGAVSRIEAQRLLCCCINGGPAFVVACVGSSMLGSDRVGWLLFAALCIGSFGSGIAGRFLVRGSAVKADSITPADSTPTMAQANPTFAESVRNAVFSTLTLCGFVLFFSFLLAVIIPPSAPSVLQFLLSVPLEVTTACAAATTHTLPPTVYLCCGALSIMGASIWMQVRSLLDRDISITPLLTSRLVHLPISLCALWVLLRIFPLPLAAAAVNTARMRMPADACCIVFLLCCTFFCVTSQDSASNPKRRNLHFPQKGYNMIAK